jgi:TonB family protein
MQKHGATMSRSFFSSAFEAVPSFSALSPSDRLGLAVAASIVLHAAVLWAVPSPATRFAHRRVFPESPSLTAQFVTGSLLESRTAPASDKPVLIALAPQPAAPELRPRDSQPAGTSGSKNPESPRDPSPPSDSGYFSQKNVDVRAAPIGEIEPANPDFTGTVSGNVTLRLQINARGLVDRVIVVRAEPDYAFGPGAFAAFEHAQFSPARIAGIPVPSEIRVEMHYGPASPEAKKAPVPVRKKRRARDPSEIPPTLRR